MRILAENSGLLVVSLLFRLWLHGVVMRRWNLPRRGCPVWLTTVNARLPSQKAANGSENHQKGMYLKVATGSSFSNKH